MLCEAERECVVLRVPVRVGLGVTEDVTVSLALELRVTLLLALTLAVSLSLTVCDHVPEARWVVEGNCVTEGEMVIVTEPLATLLAVAVSVTDAVTLTVKLRVPLCVGVTEPVLLRDPERVTALLLDALCDGDVVSLGVPVGACEGVLVPDAEGVDCTLELCD